jgi:hypothetical protein
VQNAETLTRLRPTSARQEAEILWITTKRLENAEN